MNGKQPASGKPQTEANLISPVNIGVIGYGIVGQAVAYGFDVGSYGRDHVLYYDKFKDSAPLEEVVAKSEFIFITLPTPMKQDESGIDLSIVENSVAEITKYTDNTDKIIVIKSTVTPGTTRKLELKHPKSYFCFSPEFLTEANYLDDFLSAERTIIGANNDHVSRRVAVIFRQRFPSTKIYQTDPTTAEAVKYFANAFLSMKVTFANAFFDYCQAIGIKYEEVKKMAASDPRIVDAHLDVTTLRGFGGKCFPKDMVALMGGFREVQVDVSLLKTVWEYNKKVRAIHDWKEIPFAVEGNGIKKGLKKAVANQ